MKIKSFKIFEAQRAAFSAPTPKGFIGVRDMRYFYGPTGSLWNDTPSLANRSFGILIGGMGELYAKTREEFGFSPATIPSELFPDRDYLNEDDESVYLTVVVDPFKKEQWSEIKSHFLTYIFIRFENEFKNKILNGEDLLKNITKKDILDEEGNRKVRLTARIPKYIEDSDVVIPRRSPRGMEDRYKSDREAATASFDVG